MSKRSDQLSAQLRRSVSSRPRRPMTSSSPTTNEASSSARTPSTACAPRGDSSTLMQLRLVPYETVAGDACNPPTKAPNEPGCWRLFGMSTTSIGAPRLMINVRNAEGRPRCDPGSMPSKRVPTYRRMNGRRHSVGRRTAPSVTDSTIPTGYEPPGPQAERCYRERRRSAVVRGRSCPLDPSGLDSRSGASRGT